MPPELLRLARVAAKFTGAANAEEIGFTNHMVRADLPVTFNSERVRFSLPWHQESAYYSQYVSHYTSVVLSVALFACHREHGCVEIIPRSHLRGKVQHRRSYGDPIAKKHMREEVYPEDFGFSEVAYLEFDPGDVGVMHFNVFHRSGQNSSELTRYTMLIRATNTADLGFILSP